MKKTLLFMAVVIFTAFSLNAAGEKKIWNFGGDPTVGNAWATTAGIGIGDGTANNPAFPVMINGLGLFGISSNANFGGINASAKTFTDASNVSYSFVNRFQTNGAGYASAAPSDATPLVNMPIQRYFIINVAGNSTIYMIGVTGSNSSDRKMFVTDGTTLIGSVAFPAGTGLLNDGSVTYTGAIQENVLVIDRKTQPQLLSETPVCCYCR